MKTLARTTRTLALGLIIAAALLGGSHMMHPSVAHAAPLTSCTGICLFGQDPHQAGCYSNAWVVETDWYAHGWIKTWYSANCLTNWLEVGSYSGWWVDHLGLFNQTYNADLCESDGSGDNCVDNPGYTYYQKLNDIPWLKANDWIGNMNDGVYHVCGFGEVISQSYPHTIVSMNGGCH